MSLYLFFALLAGLEAIEHTVLIWLRLSVTSFTYKSDKHALDEAASYSRFKSVSIAPVFYFVIIEMFSWIENKLLFQKSS